MYFSMELWACVRQLHISNIPHFRALSYKSIFTNPELYSVTFKNEVRQLYLLALQWVGSFHLVGWLIVEADGFEDSRW